MTKNGDRYIIAQYRDFPATGDKKKDTKKPISQYNKKNRIGFFLKGKGGRCVVIHMKTIYTARIGKSARTPWKKAKGFENIRDNLRL
jgi:hypothetical protein